MNHAEIQNVNSLHIKMQSNYKGYRSINTKHLDDYQVLAIFEQMHSPTGKSEKANMLYEILKKVKDLLTYKGLAYKEYPQFVYENIIGENIKKKNSPINLRICDDVY